MRVVRQKTRPSQPPLPPPAAPSPGVFDQSAQLLSYSWSDPVGNILLPIHQPSSKGKSLASPALRSAALGQAPSAHVPGRSRAQENIAAIEKHQLI